MHYRNGREAKNGDKIVLLLLASHPDAGSKVGVSAAQYDRLLQIKALAEMQGAHR